MVINIKRVYENPTQEDGTRVLVDRLWPRGLTQKKPVKTVCAPAVRNLTRL